MLRFLIKLVVMLMVMYGGLLLFVYFFQNRFLFFPKQGLEASPPDIGLQYERIIFPAADGVKLSAWFVPSADATEVVLFCHGNAGNISHRLDSIRIFNQLGVHVFIFDYRGYGESEGQLSEAGTYQDVQGAWNYLRHIKKFAEKNIILFGRSLGGAIAAWLAQKVKPGALIVESSFTSVADMGKKHYPFLPVRILLRYKYHTQDYITRVNCPLLVIHSPDDEIVPYSHGEKLFYQASEPKEFLRIRGSHNQGFTLSSPLYENGLKKFLNTLKIK